MMSITHAVALCWPLHFVMADSNELILHTMRARAPYKYFITNISIIQIDCNM